MSIMQQLYTNNTGISLSVAVFLAVDHYDREAAGLSVTTLMKPIRQVVLGKRVPAAEAMTDVDALIASRLGTAIHDGIEKAWVGHHARALGALGYPAAVIERVLINPTEEQLALKPDAIPVYLEVRSHKEVGGIKVSGKFDFVAEGRLSDFKTTSTYSVTSGNKDADYILQGSLYRWLNPKIVTDDTMTIEFIFTDWSKLRAMQDPNYPQKKVMSKTYHLMSVEETQAWVDARVKLLLSCMDVPEDQLPECAPDELWRSDPVFKYYKDPAKRTRSTKNFDNLADANTKLYADGNVGVVVPVPGLVKACAYCPAFTVCTQKDRLIASGDLVI
jgi:hypothetical protein